jgi:hypothetical protein
MSLEQWLLAGAAVTTVAFFVVAIYSPSTFDPDPDWGVSDGCIGGLEHQDAGISFHYHPSLKVTMDGQQLQIASNSGIDQTGCREGMRWIHVHDSSESGFTTLHIETPDRLNVPLGSFFEIWERDGGPGLTDNRTFDINRNGISDWDEYEITMLVNGDENTKYESFVMEDLAQIELTFTSK